MRLFLALSSSKVSLEEDAWPVARAKASRIRGFATELGARGALANIFSSSDESRALAYALVIITMLTLNSEHTFDTRNLFAERLAGLVKRQS